MSLVTLKNEFSEDLLACRACLVTDRKLYSLYQHELSKAYKNLIRIEVSPYDTLPQYICSYCSTLLLKYNTFREHCHQATNYLEEAAIRNKIITLDYLNSFQAHIKYKKSETKIISITENDQNNLKIDDTDDQFDNYHDNYHKHTQSPQTDLKIYTDIVKIESNQESNEIKTEKELEKSTKSTKKNRQYIDIKKKTNKKHENVKKKGKYFETKENLSDFEKAYDVNISILSKDQQMKDVLERKLSLNYLHSPYKCDLCFKGYMSADILYKHVMTQHDSSRGKVVCEFCQFRYKDQRGLNQHLKSHRLKFACQQCPFVSRNTFNAKEHFKMHGGQMHKCQHCGKSYEKLSTHLTHLRIQHPSELIWCDVCGEAFIGTFGLNAHKKRAHRHLPLPAVCTSCDKRFVDTTALQRHSCSNACGDNTCIHCGEAFTEALHLRDHLLEKHRSRKVFSCEKCNKTFSRESLYSAHYRRLHVDSEQMINKKKERPWICEVCGKTLPNKCVLMYHQRNHTGEKPYHCSQCPKSFTMRKLLQSHLRVHSSDRPFNCKLCPKAFKGLSALRSHEHIHTGGQTKASSKNRIMQ